MKMVGSQQFETPEDDLHDGRNMQPVIKTQYNQLCLTYHCSPLLVLCFFQMILTISKNTHEFVTSRVFIFAGNLTIDLNRRGPIHAILHEVKRPTIIL